ncbi:hypothetical protein [Nocardia sp. NPDC004604]|uniref:hypothetical protein n=1 Tax=Nocardia sp. NPDC004604 TaxID=3157013 RepID=UPI0033AC3FBA
MYIAPVLLGAGIRLYDNACGAPIHLHWIGERDLTLAVNVSVSALREAPTE